MCFILSSQFRLQRETPRKVGYNNAYYNDIFQYFPKIKKLIEKHSAHLEAGMIAVDFKI